jgi:hypothetical protein
MNMFMFVMVFLAVCMLHASPVFATRLVAKCGVKNGRACEWKGVTCKPTGTQESCTEECAFPTQTQGDCLATLLPGMDACNAVCHRHFSQDIQQVQCKTACALAEHGHPYDYDPTHADVGMITNQCVQGYDAGTDDGMVDGIHGANYPGMIGCLFRDAFLMRLAADATLTTGTLRLEGRLCDSIVGHHYDHPLFGAPKKTSFHKDGVSLCISSVKKADEIRDAASVAELVRTMKCATSPGWSVFASEFRSRVCSV